MDSIFTEQHWNSIFNLKKKIVFNAGAEASIEYAEQKNNFVPEIQLLFSPFGLPFVPIEIVGSNTNKIISSLAWTKDRNNPGGVLSVDFAPDAETVKEIVDIINLITGNLYSQIWGELGVEIEDLFKPMTLCQLWINGCHVMTGTVRSCKRTVSVSNEDKNVSYTIMCDELGSLYNMSTASLDLIIQDGMQNTIIDAIWKAFDLVADQKGVSIHDGISSLVSAFKISATEQGVSLSDGLPLFFRLLSTGNPIGGIANLSLANFMTIDANMFQLHSSGGGQQSIWGLLKNFIPSPWMEFFTESGGRTMVTDTLGYPATLFPGFNYIVSRTTPYSNPLLGTVHPSLLASVLAYDLNALSLLIGGDFIIITDDMLQDKSLGTDCINQKTIFHTNYSSKAATSAPDLSDRPVKSVGPLNPFASGGIPTFGMREMFQTIDICSNIGLGRSKSYSDSIARNVFGMTGSIIPKRAFNNLLATWFRNQSRFREGAVTVRGIPYARAGMYCLYLPDAYGKKKVENLRDIGLYYIDSLSHNYTLSNEDVNFSTTLNLIRGVPLPISIAQSALLLFDYELLPPESGLVDGEYSILKGIRAARRGIPL